MEERLMPYAGVRTLGQGPVLVLAPHSDDEVFGCGGAILRHVDAGESVQVVIVTDGGADVDGAGRTAYVARRREESRAAGRVLGYGEPEFWNLPDRGLAYGEALVQRVAAVIGETGAKLVYAPSIFEIHPDHRALAMATVEAVRRNGSGLALAMYEVAVPLRPNRLLDITDLRVRKRAAMECFASQVEVRDYPGHVEALNRFRAYTLPREVEAAEAFALLPAEAIDRDPLGVYTSEARYARDRGAPLDPQARPLISVIVRSVGRPALDEALDSVALQTYPQIEVVVVNALGDLHPPLPDWCGPFRLRVVAGDGGLSRSKAANLGLAAARGEYLAFLDDDDLLDPDHLQRLAEALERDPSVRAAYAGVRVIDRSSDGDRWDTVQVFHEPFNPERLVYENYIPIHAVLFHHSLLAEGCRFDEALIVYEDWDFWLQVSGCTRFLRVDRVTARYRSGGGSGVGTMRERRSSVLEHRSALYRKWIRRWDGGALDRIFDEYRRVRHDSLNQIASLEQRCQCLEQQCEDREPALLERERAVSMRERLVTEQQTAFLLRFEDLDVRHCETLRRAEVAESRRDELEQTVAALESSTSWKITAPLRWLKLRLGRAGS